MEGHQYSEFITINTTLTVLLIIVLMNESNKSGKSRPPVVWG